MQAQDQYPLRTAFDQRGEQTLNREAKSVGGIGRFGGNIDSIIKWTLNSALQAKITTELKLFAQVNKSEEMYKAFRPDQIRKSENWYTRSSNFTGFFESVWLQSRQYKIVQSELWDSSRWDQLLGNLEHKIKAMVRKDITIL